MDTERTGAEALVVVDNSFAVCVSGEKALLTQEVIKHFRSRWEKEAAESPEGAAVIHALVSTMLRKLSLEHKIIHNIRAVSVLVSGSETRLEEGGGQDA